MQAILPKLLFCAVILGGDYELYNDVTKQKGSRERICNADN